MRVLFKNGYGVSVINNEFSYGLEMAVLRWTGTWDNENDIPKEVKSEELCYDTPITDDVLGHLDDERLGEAVKQVEQLEGEVQDESK